MAALENEIIALLVLLVIAAIFFLCLLTASWLCSAYHMDDSTSEDGGESEAEMDVEGQSQGRSTSPMPLRKPCSPREPRQVDHSPEAICDEPSTSTDPPAKQFEPLPEVIFGDTPHTTGPPEKQAEPLPEAACDRSPRTTGPTKQTQPLPKDTCDKAPTTTGLPAKQFEPSPEDPCNGNPRTTGPPGKQEQSSPKPTCDSPSSTTAPPAAVTRINIDDAASGKSDRNGGQAEEEAVLSLTLDEAIPSFREVRSVESGKEFGELVIVDRVMIHGSFKSSGLKMLLDSGADFTSISEQMWADKFGAPELQKCPISVVKGFNGATSKVVGQFSVLVQLNESPPQKLTVVVIEGVCSCLFGRTWMSAFFGDSWASVLARLLPPKGGSD